MTIIRKAQPSLTSVFPHPGNRKYMIPNRRPVPFGGTTVYSFAGDDHWSTGVTNIAWDTTGVFKVSLVFRTANLPGGGAQIAIAETGSDFRSIRIASGDVVKWRDDAINLLSLMVLEIGAVYRATVDGDGAGKHTLTVEQQGGGIDAVSGTIAGDAIARPLNVGANQGAGNNFTGEIAEYSISQGGTLTNEWPMHDGGVSTTFAASVGVDDIVQQVGTGQWIEV